MKTNLLLIMLLIQAFTLQAQLTATIPLVTNQKSDYQIVIPNQPSPEETRAAAFLQEHIFKISGCRLPIVSKEKAGEIPSIFISESKEIDSGDSFRVFTDKQHIYILGGHARGCIYGVSELLEHYLGVRYFSPEFVQIPTTKDIILPAINLSGTSPNTYRNVHGQFSMDPAYRDFHRLHTIDDVFAKGYYVHTFNKLIPWKEYFEPHPEYFAWMNGKRIIDQLCLSNEEVFDLVIQKLKKEMALQPDKLIWSVSQDDNFSYCHCEHCSKITEEEDSPAGPIVRFVNRVAEVFPDKVISTLAYQYSRKAPEKTKPRENVQVMLCTIELNRSKPIVSDPTSVSFLTDMAEWGKITDHIYLWDYTVDFAHSISPFPNYHTLQPNILLFTENNIREHFQQTNTGNAHEFSELKSYLLSKMLWNPTADVQEIIREFTDGYYGPAGQWIREYLYAMENEIVKTGEWLDIYGPPNNHQQTFLSAENLKTYNRLFDEAEKAVADQPLYLSHVQTARMPLQYAMMEIGKNDMFGPRGWYKLENGKFVVREDMLQTLESFYHTGIRSKAAPVNESGLTVGEYYKATKRFIDVQVEGNHAFGKKVIAEPMPASKYSNGNLELLTNGVRGANDYKVHWLGWESQDFTLLLDLERSTEARSIEISTLYDPKSWILHPKSVSCYISDNGQDFIFAGKIEVAGDQRKEEVNRIFSFTPDGQPFRYIKFVVTGTKKLFDWHPSAGGGSWVFVDEIVVR